MAADDIGPYSRGEVGISTFSGSVGGVGIGSVIESGWSFSGAAGYQINPFFGLEGELGVTRNNIVFGLGDITTVPVLGNAVFTMPLGDTANFLITAGAGWGFVSASVQNEALVGDGAIGQLKAAVNFSLTDKTSLHAGYALRAYFEDTSIRQNIFSVGVRIKF